LKGNSPVAVLKSEVAQEALAESEKGEPGALFPVWVQATGVSLEGLRHSQQHSSPPALFGSAPVDASPSARQLCLSSRSALLAQAAVAA
jgi:hypothetical protein